MTYKVSIASTTSYSVKQQLTTNFKVSAILGEGATDVANLADLSDVNISGIQNGFVLTYNSSTGKFVAVDPDTVLSNAVTGGLPAAITNELDVALDNKIDTDGGSF